MPGDACRCTPGADARVSMRRRRRMRAPGAASCAHLRTSSHTFDPPAAPTAFLSSSRTSQEPCPRSPATLWRRRSSPRACWARSRRRWALEAAPSPRRPCRPRLRSACTRRRRRAAPWPPGPPRPPAPARCARPLRCGQEAAVQGWVGGRRRRAAVHPHRPRGSFCVQQRARLSAPCAHKPGSCGLQLAGAGGMHSPPLRITAGRRWPRRAARPTSFHPLLPPSPILCSGDC